ncbi:hypothetical protein Hdeb2414_s0010g00335251 [Helianthus debilis subsp. tardiflorus]
MMLLEEFSGFEGVGTYGLNQVPLLPEEKYVDCWSLPVVTLTAIAVSLPDIEKDIVDRLLRSVSEGHTYVKHVEETLNATDEYKIIQKAARRLWLEVEVYHKWLGNKLQNTYYEVNTPIKIVQRFSDMAKNMVVEVESKNMKCSDDRLLHRSISASSMYRITQTILVSNQDNIDQVIALKCHTGVIEKREASVHTAAQLLGESIQIINSLQDRKLPSLDPDELPFIDKWRDCFMHPSP